MNIFDEIESEKYPFDVPHSINDDFRMGFNRGLCVASRVIEQFIRKNMTKRGES